MGSQFPPMKAWLYPRAMDGESSVSEMGWPAMRLLPPSEIGKAPCGSGCGVREWTAGSARGNGRTGQSRMDLRRTCCGEWLRIRKAGSGWGLPRTSAWSILPEGWSKHGEQAARQSGIGSSRRRPIARGAFGGEERAEVWQDWIPKHRPFRDLGRHREYKWKLSDAFFSTRRTPFG